MGIDWGQVRVVSETERLCRNLGKKDVFNHVAMMARKAGYPEVTGEDVGNIYETMRRNPSVKGNLMKAMHGNLGRYCEVQLTGIWKLLLELKD